MHYPPASLLFSLRIDNVRDPLEAESQSRIVIELSCVGVRVATER